VNLTNINNQLKFSSRYLVEQINIFRKEEGNRAVYAHSDFLKKLEKEFEDEIGEGNVSLTSYLDASNRQSKQYELDFKQSLQMLMSESKTVRKRCIDVMEEQQAKLNSSTSKYSMPATHLEAARAWIAALEKNEVLQHQLEIAAPKIEIYDMAMESNDALSMNDAAKVLKLGYGRNTLFAKLRNAGILMSNNRPYQKYINNGWFRVIERPGNFSNTRSEIRVITLVLQKGLTEIVNAVK
jgi:phage antirepressor YoqD-like protein